jgi:hypothetical protein
MKHETYCIRSSEGKRITTEMAMVDTMKQKLPRLIVEDAIFTDAGRAKAIGLFHTNNLSPKSKTYYLMGAELRDMGAVAWKMKADEAKTVLIYLMQQIPVQSGSTLGGH